MGMCGGECGITQEREHHRALARVAAVTVDLPFAQELSVLDGFAEACTTALPARAVWLDGECARWLYLVATTDDHTWVEARERGAPCPEERDQTAVRVGFSHRGRFATLQECRWHGEPDEGQVWIEENRLAGIEDKRLQTFVKALQGLLRRARWLTLDAAFLTETVGDGDTLWSRLFDPGPMRETVGVWSLGSQSQGDISLGEQPVGE